MVNYVTTSAPIKKLPKIVGILNLTPDSFSDGGKYFNEESALLQLDKMLKSGANIIDIGAESTRPGAQILDAHAEILRLENLLPKIIKHIQNFNSQYQCHVTTSIDSYHYETIVFAHQLGVEIINDVSGLIDERIINYIAQHQLKTILMHNLAIHADPNIIINRELNVFNEIIQWTKQKIAFLEQRQIAKSQLIFDPGIGFGKNARQSINIIKNIKNYKILGLEILVGHSKKSFLDGINIPNHPNLDRSDKTLIISHYLAQQQVDFIRVHDVQKNIEFIQNPTSIKSFE